MSKVIDSEHELISNLRRCLEILGKMRHYQKEWEQQYGIDAKKRKKYWEAEADEYLTDLGGQPTISIKQSNG